jgi:hypothetical protein
MNPGEIKAWEMLNEADPVEICRRSCASYDPAAKAYAVRSFNSDFLLYPAEQKITGDDLFLKRLGYFFGLSVLCYLNTAMDIPPTGRLIKPSDTKGGQLFFRGTHVLPLDKLAAKYGASPEDFMRKGMELGGEAAPYGDVAVKLFPFAKIPVHILLWKQDDEFPARADLLFDSSCEMQAPLDILWSIARMTVLAMMM